MLRKDFFNRDTETVAEDLIGKFAVREIGGKEISAMITETEAYDGRADKASHASKGRTARTEVMFGQPGKFYVYLCYGMHFMLNVVTREAGYPAAILIRGVVPATSEEIRLNGPGKVTKFLKIDKGLNDRKVGQGAGLWFEDRGMVVSKNKVKRTPRIGVAYAGPVWSAKRLRFVMGD